MSLREVWELLRRRPDAQDPAARARRDIAALQRQDRRRRGALDRNGYDSSNFGHSDGGGLAG